MTLHRGQSHGSQVLFHSQGRRLTGTKFPSVWCLQRLLNYIQPTHVHVMKAGQIILSGGIEVAGDVSALLQLEHANLIDFWPF